MIFLQLEGVVVIYCGEPACGNNWTIADDLVQSALDRGEIVVRTNPQPGYTLQTVGVCHACQDKHKRARRTAKPGQRRNVDAEHAALMQLVARTREAHPTWTLKRCVHEAVEYLASPEFEPNEGFRAFLLERDKS